MCVEFHPDQRKLNQPLWHTTRQQLILISSDARRGVKIPFHSTDAFSRVGVRCKNHGKREVQTGRARVVT